MRLVNTSSLELEDFSQDDAVSYAILSHRWEGEEVSLQQFQSGHAQQKKGYQKIARCCAEAARNGFRYVWIDTCCIDKTSSAELSEAVNAMFRWYQQARACYVYLSDVTRTTDLAYSAYFTRGWTLQELIAPSNVRIYNRHWINIGTKHGLQDMLSEITGIPIRVLRGADLDTCSIAQRMSWASRRRTTRPEDAAYCLLGIFDVNMPMLYGEGMKAFTRLQEEIIKQSSDHSIFAWATTDRGARPILAPSPACFRHARNYIAKTPGQPREFMMTNVGLSISLPVVPWAMNTYLAILNCRDSTGEQELMPHLRLSKERNCVCIFLRQTENKEQFIRTTVGNKDVTEVDFAKLQLDSRLGRLLILNKVKLSLNPDKIMYGFIFRHLSSAFFPGFPYREDFDFEIESANPTMDDLSLNDNLRLFRREDDGKFPIFRPFRTGEKIPVIVSHLNAGQSGPVTSFRLQSTIAQQEMLRSGDGGAADFGLIGLIRFDFDFHFNPICSLFSTKRPPEAAGEDWNEFMHRTERLGLDAAKVDRPDEQWRNLGYCFLRGHRQTGLHYKVEFLNIGINITLGRRDATKQAWFVDIHPLALPLPARIVPDIPDPIFISSEDTGSTAYHYEYPERDPPKQPFLPSYD